MADVDPDETGSQGQDAEDEELTWEEPVENADAMEDGPRTILVGGPSRIETIDDALERYRGPGDRIVVMPGVYETGVILDSGRFPRLHIYGAHPAPTEAEEKAARAKARELEANADEIAEREAANRYLPPLTFGPEREPSVVFKGKLSVQYQQATAADEEEDAEAGGKPPLGATTRLTVSNISFQGGATIAEECDVKLAQCTFGIPHLPATERTTTPSDDAVREPRTVRISAFAKPTFERCRIYGADRSAVYCYPYAAGTLVGCDIVGMVDTPPAAVVSPSRRVRVAAPTPPPPATKAPGKCLSDAGIHLDDAMTSFQQCAVRNFNLGVVTNEACKGCKLTECSVFEVASVGYLFGAGSAATLRECKARLCGREAVVVGARSHVSMRDSCFSGDVRLQDESILTALVDNFVGPASARFKVVSEAKPFSERGFVISEDDPTQRKKRKPVVQDE